MFNTNVELPIRKDGTIEITNKWLETLATDMNGWAEEFDHYEYYDCLDENTVEKLKNSMRSKDELSQYIHSMEDYLEEIDDAEEALKAKGLSILTRLEIAEGMAE